MMPKQHDLLFLTVFCHISLLISKHSVASENRTQYLHRRSEIVREEWEERTGSDIVLTKSEQRVNDIVKTLKRDEITKARQSGGVFPPSLHFFKAKPLIENSQVFKIIRSMPKGAVLHVHDASMVDVHWVIRKATYLDNCFMCTDQHNNTLRLHFFHATPPITPGCQWETVNSRRAQSGNPKMFDDMLYHNMTLVVDDPDKTYPTQDTVWARFMAIFQALNGIVYYAPIFEAFFREALKEFYDDNVQYIEMRALLLSVYEDNNTIHGREWVVDKYRNISKQFTTDHPDYVGTKIIFTVLRHQDNSAIKAAVMDALSLRKKFPNFVAGFDLVGQEDPGYPLRRFIDELLLPSQMAPPVPLPYFFHAGETDWEDEDVDQNLIDALLLNTSRIGHGFALPKHPVAMKMGQEKGVPIELNPISNQVLGLVRDLRDHPASYLLARGYPVVVSSDDPALWGAQGVSYDWYEVFMAIGGDKSDLRMLKRLAMDSIKYSALTNTERQHLMDVWQRKWDKFIQDTLKKFNYL